MSLIIFLKSALHNIGVVVVGFAFAAIGVEIDRLISIAQFHSIISVVMGAILLFLGFALRVWATYLFYEQQMDVIRLVPQQALLTTGPYRFSRNPLYLGGNVFIFLGAVLVLGSPSGIVLTMLQLIPLNFMVQREERQLAHRFGTAWGSYCSDVRRWL